MGKDTKIIEGITRLLVEFLREQEIEPEEAEIRVREVVHKGGAAALGQRWSEEMAGEEPEKIGCECGGSLKRRSTRKKRLLTLLGPTKVERAYYWCRRCGKGRHLLDERLGCRGRAQTGKVQECVALTMAEETYAGGRRLLSTLANLEIPHHTLETITVELGEALVEERDEQTARAFETEIESPERPETLCVTTDGAKVPMRDGWREARLVAVFPHDIPPGGSEPESGRISYSARVEDCEATGKRMYAEAQRRGAAHAKRIAVIGDGAEWIWNQAAEHFPQVIEVVDWFHATEHLWEVANGLFDQGSDKARAWEQAREQELKEGDVRLVIARLRKLLYEKRRKKKRFRGSEQEHVLQRNLAYFESHQKRMDYARFRDDGLPIASGVVESACKHYVAQRCKRSGMQWNKSGLHPVLELRSALLSNEWHRVQNLFKAA